MKLNIIFLNNKKNCGRVNFDMIYSVIYRYLLCLIIYNDMIIEIQLFKISFSQN